MLWKQPGEDIKNHIRQTIIIFGGLAIAILLLFELSKFSLLGRQESNDLYIVISGSLFILVGFIIHKLLSKKGSGPVMISKAGIDKSGLSKQEHKILILMADGLLNIEIAESLFIAPSTVKTHVSHILGKLNAKRRTEAIKIGRDLEIL